MGLLRPSKSRLHHCLILLIFFLVSIACGVSHKAKPYGSANAKNETERYQKMEVIARYGKSLLGQVSSIPVLVLRGSYQELGEAHGALAGKEIIQLLDNILIPYVNHAQTNAWDRRVLPTASTFVFPASYESELKGIIQGIKNQYPNKSDRMLSSINREIDLKDLRALNCFTEMMYLATGCTSFSAWGALTENGEVICGRNLDGRFIPGDKHYMIVAREPVDGNRQATIEISGPGLIGVSTAMNEDGVIVMSHYENGLQSSAAETWVPRSIVLRDAIESVRGTDSMDQIARIFKNRTVRLGSNTHIAFPINGNGNRLLPFVLEWDGNSMESGVTVRSEDPSTLKDAIICTNHYIKRRPEKSASLESRMRFQGLVDRIQKLHVSNGLIDAKKAIMMMDSVARNGSTVTYLTVIALPKERKIYFAFSPKPGVSATRGKWIEILWNRVFGVF